MDIVSIALSRATHKGFKIQTQINWVPQEKEAPSENHMYLPLIDVAKAIEGEENALCNKYFTHGCHFRPVLSGQPYWPQIGMREKLQQIVIPLNIFEDWLGTCVKIFLKYLILMWDLGHAQEIRVRTYNTEHSMMLGDGTIRWLDWVIKGVDIGDEDNPPVFIFVQGNNQKRYYDQWLPPRVRYSKYSFLSRKVPRGRSLVMQPLPGEPPIHYLCDPNNPHLNIRDIANHRLSQYRNRNWYLSWNHAHYYYQGVGKE